MRMRRPGRIGGTWGRGRHFANFRDKDKLFPARGSVPSRIRSRISFHPGNDSRRSPPATRHTTVKGAV